MGKEDGGRKKDSREPNLRRWSREEDLGGEKDRLWEETAGCGKRRGEGLGERGSGERRQWGEGLGGKKTAERKKRVGSKNSAENLRRGGGVRRLQCGKKTIMGKEDSGEKNLWGGSGERWWGKRKVGRKAWGEDGGEGRKTGKKEWGKRTWGKGMGKEKVMGWKKDGGQKKKKQEGKKMVGIDDGWEKRWEKNLRRQHEERKWGKIMGKEDSREENLQ